jgi:hypothetical protein
MKKLIILLLCAYSFTQAMVTNRQLAITTTPEMAILCTKYKSAIGPVIAALYARGIKEFSAEKLNKIILHTMFKKISSNIETLEDVMPTLEGFKNFLAHDSLCRPFSNQLLEKAQSYLRKEIDKAKLLNTVIDIRNMFIRLSRP